MHRLPYRQPAVRDLAWSLSSPPLLLRDDPDVYWPDADWFAGLGTSFHQRLLQLDADPRPLMTLLDESRDRRLGSRFEAFWRYWLEANPRYRLLHANLPVRAGGATLGEFDLIVRDNDSGKVLHWELAVKFFLGAGDTRQAANWRGPGKRDRLDIKTDRLLLHQARLSRHPLARRLLTERRLHIDETWVIMKGRLFYPHAGIHPPPAGAHPRHLRGFRVTTGELESLADGAWQVLEKTQWFAPVANHAATGIGKAELIERLRGPSEHQPVCIARCAAGAELERGFVVADGWQEPW
jgi:hypothetical protein